MGTQRPEFLVRPVRFERTTHGFEGHCSIQLSYGRASCGPHLTRAGRGYQLTTPLTRRSDNRPHRGRAHMCKGGGSRPSQAPSPRLTRRFVRAYDGPVRARALESLEDAQKTLHAPPASGARASRHPIEAPEVYGRGAITRIVNALPPVERAYSRVRFSILRSKLLSVMDLLLTDEGRILDVGCGFGLFAAYFGQTHPRRRIVGVDPSVRRIALATRRRPVARAA